MIRRRSYPSRPVFKARMHAKAFTGSHDTRAAFAYNQRMVDMSENPAPDARLIEIPYVDATEGGPLTVAQAETARLMAIVTQGRQKYGTLAIGLGDVVSRLWLRRQRNALYDEINDVAGEAGRFGAWLLNLSYEWTCTTGAGPDPSGTGNRMLRTLDVTSRQVVWLFFKQLWFEFVPVLHGLQGRFTAQG